MAITTVLTVYGDESPEEVVGEVNHIMELLAPGEVKNSAWVLLVLSALAEGDQFDMAFAMPFILSLYAQHEEAFNILSRHVTAAGNEILELLTPLAQANAVALDAANNRSNRDRN